MPPAYDNLLSGHGSSSPSHRYLVCGARPMLAMYSTAGCEQSYFSAKALASNVAAQLGTAMLSVVSSFWGSGRDEPPQLKKGRGGGGGHAAGTLSGHAAAAQSAAAKERATALRCVGDGVVVGMRCIRQQGA